MGIRAAHHHVRRMDAQSRVGGNAGDADSDDEDGDGSSTGSNMENTSAALSARRVATM